MRVDQNSYMYNQIFIFSKIKKMQNQTFTKTSSLSNTPLLKSKESHQKLTDKQALRFLGTAKLPYRKKLSERP